MVNIAEIGTAPSTDPDSPGGSLVCVTSLVNTECCRTSDGGNVGEWFFPDGSMVPRGSSPGDSAFTRTGSYQQVRLNRRFSNATEPNGTYECRVPFDIGSERYATITLTVGKCHARDDYRKSFNLKFVLL